MYVFIIASQRLFMGLITNIIDESITYIQIFCAIDIKKKLIEAHLHTLTNVQLRENFSLRS